MNVETSPDQLKTVPPPPPGPSETVRTIAFLIIQGLFFLISPITGGFQYKVWSMLDSALLLLAIGVTALVFVLDTAAGRRLAIKTGVILYLFGVLDMSINLLVAGWIGWKL